MNPRQTPILDGDDPASIQHAVELLRAGGLVGMPTETVYGLAANALDPVAVAKIFEAKARPSFDPLIVHVHSTEQAAGLAAFDETAVRLSALWPGPLTLVLPRKRDAQGEMIVPDLVTSGLESVGVRMPDHPVALALLRQSDLPLAAPSANRFGAISPTRAQHVVDALAGRVDAVLDGGRCLRGIESTVVRVVDGVVEVLRLGALTVEEIQAVVGGPVRVRPPSSAPGRSDQSTAEASAKPSPGMVERHYAPGTPMVLVDTLNELPPAERAGRIGVIGVKLPLETAGFTIARDLSAAGDLAEAASRLFQTLRELDGKGLDRIIALRVPDRGLGRAINDRLTRGSAR